MSEQRDTPEPVPDERETAYELLQRGHDLLTQRHFAQAAVVLERADRDEPGKASILEALGRAYYNSGQHERSRATFEQLLELDPSAHYAHFALGQSLKQLGRRDEARTHLRLALALSPTSTLYAGALSRLPASQPPPAPPTDESAEGDPGP
jgi:tetratricopeptide (TPR) repeat protein